MIIKVKYEIGQKVLINDGSVKGEISSITIMEGGRIMYSVEYWIDDHTQIVSLYERQIQSEGEAIKYITVVTGSGVAN